MTTLYTIESEWPIEEEGLVFSTEKTALMTAKILYEKARGTKITTYGAAEDFRVGSKNKLDADPTGLYSWDEAANDGYIGALPVTLVA